MTVERITNIQGCHLAADVAAGDATCQVDALPATLPSAGQVRISWDKSDNSGNEIAIVQLPATGSGPYTLTFLQRGAEGTTPGPHGQGCFLVFAPTAQSLRNLSGGVRRVTAIADAITEADARGTVVYSAPCAVTLPRPSSGDAAGGIGDHFWTNLSVLPGGPASLTLSPPAGCLIDGQAGLTLPAATGLVLTTDGTNYFTLRGLQAPPQFTLQDFTEFLAEWTEQAQIPMGRDAAYQGLPLVQAIIQLLQSSVGTGAAVSGNPQEMCGRLTASAGTPITSTDQTAITTLYYTPYRGDWLLLWNGSTWSATPFSETSIAVPATTTTPFDVFAYLTATGGVAFETVNWSSDTARATNVTLTDGLWTKSGDKTRLLVGVSRTTGVSGQTEDSRTSRFVVSVLNPLPRSLRANPGYVDDNASTSYTTTSTTWVEANGGTNNRVNFLTPLVGWPVHLVAHGSAFNSGNFTTCLGFGIDSASTAAFVGHATNGAGLPSCLSAGPTTDHTLFGAHFAALLITVVAGTGTYFADLQRFGGSSDPRETCLEGWILG